MLICCSFFNLLEKSPSRSKKKGVLSSEFQLYESERLIGTGVDRGQGLEGILYRKDTVFLLLSRSFHFFNDTIIFFYLYVYIFYGLLLKGLDLGIAERFLFKIRGFPFYCVSSMPFL